MKKSLLILACAILLNTNIKAEVISGQINHDDVNFQNRVIDSKTNKALPNAKITIPQIDFTTYSDAEGNFKLNANVEDKTVLFVEKEGYKTFSLTVDNNVFNSPLRLGIEQSSPFDLQISQGIIRLGDNMFSSNSANCNEFRGNANGHYYKRNFKKPKYTDKQDVAIRIGTIIGLDTKKAKEIGQNRIAKVYSSPMEVFVNGKKIAKVELNGDNLAILIPKRILKEENELLIKTGQNLFQINYVDYDDIEIANLRIEVIDRFTYAKN